MNNFCHHGFTVSTFFFYIAHEQEEDNEEEDEEDEEGADEEEDDDDDEEEDEEEEAEESNLKKMEDQRSQGKVGDIWFLFFATCIISCFYKPVERLTRVSSI